MSWLTKPTAPLRWLELHFDHQLDPASVEQFVRSILSAGNLGSIVFEAEHHRSQLVYRVGSSYSAQIRRLLSDFLPRLTVTEATRKLPADGSGWRVTASTSMRPWRIDDLEAASLAILGSLGTSSEVAAGYQVVVGKRLSALVVPDKMSVTPGETPTAQLLNAALGRTHRPDREAHRALRDKQREPGARVTLRLFAHGTAVPPRSLPAGFLAALRTRQTGGLHLDLRRESWNQVLTSTPHRRAMPLNAKELSSILAWPFEERSYPGVDRERPATRASATARSGDRILGYSTHPGPTGPVGLSVVDGLRHLHVLGPTGVGKSTLLLNLILQDIEAGRAVVVIEPKGDLVDDVLARVPLRHLERLVVLDPSYRDHIIGFNPLVGVGDRDVAVDGIVHIFRSLNQTSWGPRTQDILHASLLTLAESADYNSLVHIPELLTDARFRAQVLSGVKLRRPLRSFWHWFHDLSDAERANITAPLLNKLRPFTLRPALRAVLAAPQPFDLNRVFTEKRVLLVPLRVGVLGSEVAYLLGAMIMSRLWQLALARTGIAPGKRHPVSLYADEFQSYTRLPTDFGDVLAQARGVGLGMTLAHQNLAQLEPSLRSIVLANVQNRALFRLGTEDATVMAKHTDGLRPQDLARLPRYEIYAQLLRDGDLRSVASARTQRPVRPVRDPRRAIAEIAEREGTALAEEPAAGSGFEQPSGDEEIGRRKRGGE